MCKNAKFWGVGVLIFALFGLNLGMDIDIPGMNCPMTIVCLCEMFQVSLWTAAGSALLPILVS